MVSKEAPHGSKEAKIQEALSAAQEKVAMDATVMDYPEKEGASPTELRKGTNDWVTSPPHTMVFPTGKLDPAIYGTNPKKGGPWIMWAGTPYEHLMVPVK